MGGELYDVRGVNRVQSQIRRHMDGYCPLVCDRHARATPFPEQAHAHTVTSVDISCRRSLHLHALALTFHVPGTAISFNSLFRFWKFLRSIAQLKPGVVCP